jgi:hypothetical protein
VDLIKLGKVESDKEVTTTAANVGDGFEQIKKNWVKKLVKMEVALPWCLLIYN